MTTLEKLYCLFAIAFALAFLTVLYLIPETRQLSILLPAGLVAIAVNIGLIFTVLRDILCRRFATPTARYLWLAVILLFWPAVLYYLPRHGFRKRK